MTTLILAASAPLSAGNFYATSPPVIFFPQFSKQKFFCCTSKETYCTAHLGALPDPLLAALRCDVFACCGKERETRRSDALERRKLEFIIFFSFFGLCFWCCKESGGQANSGRRPRAIRGAARALGDAPKNGKKSQKSSLRQIPGWYTSRSF